MNTFVILLTLCDDTEDSFSTMMFLTNLLFQVMVEVAVKVPSGLGCLWCCEY